MKNLLFTAILLMGIQSLVHSTVWRVNNLPGANAHFTTLQAAHNSTSVLAGDTLYLEASSGSYGDLTATKRLVIIGAGYFLTENPTTQANFNNCIVGFITFNDGSQGSIIAGCKIYKVILNTSNIVIQRNFISYNSSWGAIIFGQNNINNIIIRNNYIQNINDGNVAILCHDRTGINNVLILNNYIQVTYVFNYALQLNDGFSGIIENNVFFGRVLINNSTFNNNILRDGVFTQSNVSYSNNIGNSTQFGTANGNQSIVNMANVFVGATGNSTDGQWQLKPGSPAIGAGVGGVDCGMYGGTFPYKLSGIPAIPTIYFHEQVIDNVNQELNVTIKAKSQN